jgi:hypothetical protein
MWISNTKNRPVRGGLAENDEDLAGLTVDGRRAVRQGWRMKTQREPFFGGNAKPFFLQALAAVVVIVLIKLFLWEWVSPEAIKAYRCAIGWGPC